MWVDVFKKECMKDLVSCDRVSVVSRGQYKIIGIDASVKIITFVMEK